MIGVKIMIAIMINHFSGLVTHLLFSCATIISNLIANLIANPLTLDHI